MQMLLPMENLSKFATTLQRKRKPRMTMLLDFAKK